MNYKLAFIIFTLIILILINYTNSIKNKIKKIQFMLPSNTKILEDYKRLNINSYISSNFKIKINKSNMIYITDFLNKSFFDSLKDKCLKLKHFRSNFGFRAGGGISKYKLTDHYLYNDITEPLNLYYSTEFISLLNALLNTNINRTNPLDDASCSLIYYENPGDYIDWHYDYNSYYGSRYTVLITLLNTDNNDSLSDMEFCYKNNDKTECLKTEENSIFIFNGSDMKHIATQIGNKQKRIILSLTVCDVCVEKNDIIHNVYEYIKKLVFYGQY